MKRYKLTLIPEGHIFETLFDDKNDASTFVLQYICNHPDDKLTMFDFRLDECEAVATDLTTYSRALSVLGNIDHTTISVDSENETALTALDELLTIARAWNKVDGTKGIVPHPDSMRYFPQFSDEFDDERHFFCYERPMGEDHDFGIEALIGFRTNQLAESFSRIFKDKFRKLFNIPEE